MRECFGKALRGERQIVFVTGEPGIGKTAVVDEFMRRAAAETPGVRIARGQCIEGYGSKEAYYPMLEALGQLCRGAGGDSVLQILVAQAPTWLVQFPALIPREHRESLQREILGATRERMLREIGDALEAIASQSPLLVVFEDLQTRANGRGCRFGGSRFDLLLETKVAVHGRINAKADAENHPVLGTRGRTDKVH